MSDLRDQIIAAINNDISVTWVSGGVTSIIGADNAADAILDLIKRNTADEPAQPTLSPTLRAVVDKLNEVLDIHPTALTMRNLTVVSQMLGLALNLLDRREAALALAVKALSGSELPSRTVERASAFEAYLTGN